MSNGIADNHHFIEVVDASLIPPKRNPRDGDFILNAGYMGASPPPPRCPGVPYRVTDACGKHLIVYTPTADF
jgi:hypothetical protein